MMIYLASPYSHPDAAIRKQRYHAACRATAEMMREGHIVFCPIAHSHPLVEHGLPTGWAYWERCDRAFLERGDEVAVLTLDGWQDSIGVQAEIRIATELGKPVRYLAPELADGSAMVGQVTAK